MYANAPVTNSMNSSLPRTEMPTTQVELSISCRKLLNKDVLSKSDPQCVVYMKNSWQANYFEIGRTEVIQDNLDPEFVKNFILNYNFEVVQKMKFVVWDIDTIDNEFLGETEVTLGEIVAYQGTQYVRPLTGIANRNCGEIVFVVEEVSTCKKIAQMKFKGYNLTKQSWFSRNDPFLVISRSNEDGSHSVIHKTVQCRSTNNPEWSPFTLKAQTLCNGDFDRTIRFACYDYRYDGSHKLIGTFSTNLNTLSKGSAENKYELVHSELQKRKKSYKNSGMIELVSINIAEEITFLDYIRNGTEMHFAVAVDYTASNGDVRDTRSLHYLDYQGRPNSYEIALRSVGEIIQQYDTKEMFAGFGFGAKIPPTGQVSHQFPLNGNQSHPYCRNVEELVGFYKQSLSFVTLYGPTNFAPVINHLISIANGYQDGKNYFTLLIITDGIISDMPQTKNAIIAASRLPISIIIVGVGNADFSAMDELDSDNVLLSNQGKVAERDIVQFVPLNKYLGNGPWIQQQAELAKEVLYEVPNQMLLYMTRRGFKPIKNAT